MKKTSTFVVGLCCQSKKFGLVWVPFQSIRICGGEYFLDREIAAVQILLKGLKLRKGTRWTVMSAVDDKGVTSIGVVINRVKPHGRHKFGLLPLLRPDLFYAVADESEKMLEVD